MKNKPTIAISPVSNYYLTKGKEYDIIFIIESTHKRNFCVRCDQGDIIWSHEHDSLHTDGLSWTLK